MSLTHADLVQLACRWLRSRSGARCTVVFAEMVCGSVFENPDAIGWSRGGVSTAVECKTSRSDFRRDQDKWCVLTDSRMGRRIYYLTPAGLLSPGELPEGCGLLETDGKRVRVVHDATWRDLAQNVQRAEAAFLAAAVRRHELGVQWFPKVNRFEAYRDAKQRAAATARGAE